MQARSRLCPAVQMAPIFPSARSLSTATGEELCYRDPGRGDVKGGARLQLGPSRAPLVAPGEAVPAPCNAACSQSETRA